MTSKIILARIGYMTFYKGTQLGDEKPVGGGKYNKDKIGHEIYNFKDIKGNLYGYFQPYDRNNIDHLARINLKRIDPNANDSAEKLEDVLVIFFSSNPVTKKQVIVGWYKKATVYREFQNDTEILNRNDFGYNLICSTKNAVLLPSDKRIPLYFSKNIGKKDKPGRSNIFYLTDQNYQARIIENEEYLWLKKIIDFVSMYNSSNLLVDPNCEIEETIEIDSENALIIDENKGFLLNSKLKKIIEDYSMKKAILYLLQNGFHDIQDTSNYESYDLKCLKDNIEFYIEVKGTQTKGNKIILTYNEVELMKNKKINCILIIVNSILVEPCKNNYNVSAGEIKMLNPFVLEECNLKAISYNYNV